MVLVAPSEVALPNSPVAPADEEAPPPVGVGRAFGSGGGGDGAGPACALLLSSSASDCCWFIITIGCGSHVGGTACAGGYRPSLGKSGMFQLSMCWVSVTPWATWLADVVVRKSRIQGESSVPLLNGVERSLIGTCDVVAADLPDVVSKVKSSLHTPQLVLDGSPDALQVFERFHLGGPFVQHGRCHEHRLQMNDCSRPLKRQVISH